MRYLSVCSGIEAATAAWHHMGWQPAAFSEIEPFPSAVLAHHYPNVPNVGDMTKYEDWNVGQIDLLVGGTPCQAFSVAGLRGGLSDARGNLSLVFCKMADHFDPEYVLWENVPGVLSSTDNAFGCFLAGLSGASEPISPGRKWSSAGVVSGPKRTVAWRTLDAQFFGVAQRRRRVFVLAVRGAGNWAACAALFPVGEGVFWNSAPSRKAREDAARGAERGTYLGNAEGGSVGVPFMTASSQMRCVNNQTPLVGVAHTLRGEGFDASEDGTGRGTPLVPVAFQSSQSGVRVSGTHATLDANNGARRHNGVLQPVTYDLFNVTAPVNRQNRTPGDPCHTLARSNAEHAVLVAPSLTASNDPSRSPQSSEVTQQVYAVLQATQQAVGTDVFNGGITGDIAATMGTRGSSQNASGPTVMQAMPQAVAIDTYNQTEHDTAHTIRAGAGMEGVPATYAAMQVRRLTPVECERLQGFPDNFTAIPWRKAEAADCPDGPRYKALGNSMAVPVMRWIGERIQGVHQ